MDSTPALYVSLYAAKAMEDAPALVATFAGDNQPRRVTAGMLPALGYLPDGLCVFTISSNARGQLTLRPLPDRATPGHALASLPVLKVHQWGLSAKARDEVILLPRQQPPAKMSIAVRLDVDETKILFFVGPDADPAPDAPRSSAKAKPIVRVARNPNDHPTHLAGRIREQLKERGFTWLTNPRGYKEGEGAQPARLLKDGRAFESYWAAPPGWLGLASAQAVGALADEVFDTVLRAAQTGEGGASS